MAVAGGVSIVVPVRSGYLYQESGMLSVDGHCRPFDAKATGTTFGDGAAIVTLKRLEDAKADGDTIYAVIRGVGINNDGAKKASYTAPSVQGQAAVVAMAHAAAEVDPRSISYVETHGTATPMGDPIEIEALTLAFRAGTADKQFCSIGSLKSNVGHLVIAAGGASLIKTALSLKHRMMPASLYFDAPNPQIDFANSPFVVNTKLRTWEGSYPLRAGVSSFGVGGANAHLVVEEPPAPDPTGATRPLQLLLLSARTTSSLDRATEKLSSYLKGHAETPIGDVAYTLARGRKAFAERRVVVCSGASDAASALGEAITQRAMSRRCDGNVPEIAFQFPGQGSQHVKMGMSLFQGEPAFRAVVDLCAEYLLPILHVDLREILYPKPGAEDSATESLRSTEMTQPALFVVSYAMASLLQHWGIRPSVMIGHSIGEFVCAALASVFSVEDALTLVAQRGLLMREMPPGAMLSVRMSASDLTARLRDERISIAVHNAPLSCVASGPFDAIGALQKELEGADISCRLLQTSHAFHSSMMQPAAEAFEKVVASMKLSRPQIPFVSTATGKLITDDEAMSPRYWASQLRQTVRFSEGVSTLLNSSRRILVEVGPRMTLTTLARQQSHGKSSPTCLATLGDKAEPLAEWASVLSCVGQLWLNGVPLDWRAFYFDEKRQRIPLPTYQFEHQRHWIDPAARSTISQDNATKVQKLSQVVTQSQPSLESVATPAADPVTTGATLSTAAVASPSPSRVGTYIESLKSILEEASGIEVGESDLSTSFLYLGLDSLFLTQVTLTIQKRFGLKLSFRQLIEQYPSVQELAEHMDREIPPDPTAPAPIATATAAAPVLSSAGTAPAQTTAIVVGAQGSAITHQQVAPQAAASFAWPVATAGVQPPGSISSVIDQQLRVMSQQLALLSGVPMMTNSGVGELAQVAPQPDPVAAAQSMVTDAPTASADSQGAGPIDDKASDAQTTTGAPEPKKTFGAMTKISLAPTEELTQGQKSRLDAFIRRYTSRTASSKRVTQQNRSRLADPRVVSGFRPVLKELVYPLIVERSSGSKFWDIDGNEYVDVQCGFGSCFFGWSPPFIIDAIKAQLDRGIEIGPQHPLAGEVAGLFCDMTGAERAAFCNTGSEAVMGALRVSRTVTGRRMVATFTGDYHGIFDEVIVRGTKKLRSVPAAPGIMASTAENIMVIDYGTPESLDILRAHADELAAVLVEPVQSRKPELQPRDFLHEVRKITEKSGTALIFDEVVTGFRVGPGGAQAHFGVRADIGTYGKVVGGGLSIGVIAGKRQFMDALDGGDWQFGDDSAPTVGVTYFAGTFVRHPAALAAAKAVLTYLKEQGPELQAGVARKVETFAKEMNEHFEKVGAPMKIGHFSSIWKPTFTEDLAFGELLSAFMRDAGVHIRDGFPCFFTTAHSDADIAHIANAFKAAIAEMQASGFMPGKTPSDGADRVANDGAPPVPGARLGRDPDGTPAWYAPHPTESGKFVRVGAAN
jgi:acyl transferase domain-containing protein